MIYPHRCDCGNYSEVIRPASEAADPVICSCGQTMVRIWTPVPAKISGGGYYDYGLGCRVENKSEAAARLKAKDVHPIEVGNDRRALNAIRPEVKSYDIPRGAIDGMD